MTLCGKDLLSGCLVGWLFVWLGRISSIVIALLCEGFILFGLPWVFRGLGLGVRVRLGLRFLGGGLALRRSTRLIVTIIEVCPLVGFVNLPFGLLAATEGLGR